VRAALTSRIVGAFFMRTTDNPVSHDDRLHSLRLDEVEDLQPDRAVREVQQAFDLAESKKDPYSIGIAGSMLCWLQFARRDPLDAIRTATPARSSHADSGSSHPSGARQDGVIALIARGNFASRACGSCATPRIVCIRWMAARLPRAVRFGGRGGDSFARIAAIWSALL